MSDYGEMRETLERRGEHPCRYYDPNTDEDAGTASKGECDDLQLAKREAEAYAERYWFRVHNPPKAPLYREHAFRALWIACGIALALLWVASARAAVMPFPEVNRLPSPLGTCLPAHLHPNMTGIIVAWHCDENHVWKLHWVGGPWSNIKKVPEYLAIATDFMGDPTLDKAHSLWDQYVTVDSEDPSMQPLTPLVASVSNIVSTPPSGWVAQDTAAYKQRQAIINGVSSYTWVKIGTVALNTPCDDKTGSYPYFAVPRSAVTLASKFDTYPVIVYAKCAP